MSDEIAPVRCEVAVPTLREWVDATHPPSPLTWHREFVPALRGLLADNDRLRAERSGLVWTDGEAYQDWLNDLMAHAGDEWDADEAMEAIATRYVHHLVAENERLRAALQRISEYGGGDGGDWVECCNIAAAALQGEPADDYGYRECVGCGFEWFEGTTPETHRSDCPVAGDSGRSGGSDA